MQIAGGNWQIFDNMVRQSNATTLLNTTVSSISKTKGRYSIKSLSSASETGETLGNEEPYDTIVLAAPLQFSNITIDSGILKHTPDEIPYVRLHVTLFTSPQRLNPGFFNITPGAEMPTTILTTLPPDEIPATPEYGAGSPGFFSISTLRSVINPATVEKEYLYKIFSPKAVTPDFLSKLLNSSSTSSHFLTLTKCSAVMLTRHLQFQRLSLPPTLPSHGTIHTSGTLTPMSCHG